MSGKVTGVTSEEIGRLKQQQAKLQHEAREALVSHYAAPDGTAGDAQRADANKRIQDAWEQGEKITARIAALQGLQAEALKWKDDLGRWLNMT